MSKIAFIGLGIMGSPMAVHLQNAGNEVAGYNQLAGHARHRSSRPAAGRPSRSPTRSPTPRSSP